MGNEGTGGPGLPPPAGGEAPAGRGRQPCGHVCVSSVVILDNNTSASGNVRQWVNLPRNSNFVDNDVITNTDRLTNSVRFRVFHDTPAVHQRKFVRCQHQKRYSVIIHRMKKIVTGTINIRTIDSHSQEPVLPDSRRAKYVSMWQDVTNFLLKLVALKRVAIIQSVAAITLKFGDEFGFFQSSWRESALACRIFIASGKYSKATT